MTKLSFVGDLRLLTPDQIKLSSDLKTILDECDFNVLNFEMPLKAKESEAISKSGPALYQSDKAPSWIEKNGWNVVSLANNHSMDYGEQSLKKTIEAFNESQVIGAGSFDDAYSIKVVTSKEGERIGFVAGTHKEFGVLDDLCDQSRLGSAWICHPQMISTILRGKKEVDILIAIVHAGIEGLEQPLPEWRHWYRMMIDLGCDAVIASHPHVPQGWEMYHNKPIFYSLGNFCFQKDNHCGEKYWYNSICCKLQYEGNFLKEVEVYPLIYDDTAEIVEFDKTVETQTHLSVLNRVLADDNKYDEFINESLLPMWHDYENLFQNSGFILDPFSIYMASAIKKKIVGGDFNKCHFLNNIQCESHRWALERIIRLKHHIKY